MRVAFTGGGTGGHVYPNIAIYEAIKEKYPDAAILYIGTKSGAESRIVKKIPQPIDFVSVLSKGLPQNIRSPKTLISVLYILLGAIKSFFILRSFKPDIIIGSGGYVAAPVLIAASLLRLKVFVHEQNAVPGRLNRFIARFATKIGVSFSSTADYFPSEKVMVTGYPLRRSIVFNKAENIKKKYKIPEKNRVIFIFGGSGGARTINTVVAELVPHLLSIDQLTIILSTGRGYSQEYRAYEDTIKILKGIGLPLEIEGRLIVAEYFDNIDEIYSISDLIISRAGAGTIKEITTLGIPAILIPKIDLPGDHQIQNAKEVEKIGGARVVSEEVIIRDKHRQVYISETALLKTIEELLQDPEALFTMKKNLKEVEKQNSSDLILKEIESIILGKNIHEEMPVRFFYLQSLETEKNIELIFDSNSIGNSFLGDFFLEHQDKDLMFEIRLFPKEDKIILRRKRGELKINDVPVEKWAALKEEDRIQLDHDTLVLKSYMERVQKLDTRDRLQSNNMRSSLGMGLSRIGGLFREAITAAYFGAGQAMDIFAVGLTITNFMRRVVGEKSLERIFRPIFQNVYVRSNRRRTWETSFSILNTNLVLAFLLTVLGVVFTPKIIQVLFPGFVEKGWLNEASLMIRIMIPYLFLISIISVLTTFLKIYQRNGLAEFSAIFFSIGVMGGIVFFYAHWKIVSLAWGFLLGGILQLLFLLPFLITLFSGKNLEFKYYPVAETSSPYYKKYFRQLLPHALNSWVSKLSGVIDQFFASGMAAGSISFLYYARIIFRLPFDFISRSINTVILKEFSDDTVFFDREKTKHLFLDGIQANIFLLTPVSILIFILAEPLVSVLLERGYFTPENTFETALALKCYALGLIGWGLHAFMERIFQARMEQRWVFTLNFLMIVTQAALCLSLINTSLKFAGLALSTSISFILFAIIRIIVLKNHLMDEFQISYRAILISTIKTFFTALLMVIVLMQAKFLFQEIRFNSDTSNDILLLISLPFIGISIYLLSSIVLKNTDIFIFRKKIMRKEVKVPVSMLSPFRFYEKVQHDPDFYRDDYLYKINIYMASRNWEVKNIGIKLIGLFRDKSKTHLLIEFLKSKPKNGFMLRNALFSLKNLGYWDPELQGLVRGLWNHSYYEVRVALLQYLTKVLPVSEFNIFRDSLVEILKNGYVEEKLAGLKMLAKFGDIEDLKNLEDYHLDRNSLVREEFLELLRAFFHRGLLSSKEVKLHLERLLITSNNLSAEFKLKSLMSKLFKEIE